MSDELGAMLRATRVKCGLTHADVVRELGVTTQSASRLENNVGRASFDRVHRLSLLLGRDVPLQLTFVGATKANVRQLRMR